MKTPRREGNASADRLLDVRGSAVTDEYLTIAELATRLKLSPKTIRNRMHDGTWRRGDHWFRRTGIGPRFRWLAVVAWLEAEEVPGRAVIGDEAGAAYGADIPPVQRGRRRVAS